MKFVHSVLPAANAAGIRLLNAELETDLSSKSIDAEGAEVIANDLADNMHVLTLILSKNAIGDEGCHKLARALKTNSTLESIWLDDNGIGDTGSSAIAAAVQEADALTTLILNGNNIGPVGAVALVKENSRLVVLGLSRNSLGDEGAVAIADALTGNTTLSSLDLTGNGITDVGATALLKVLTEYKNCTLLSLLLEENLSISPTLRKAIDFVLTSRAALHSLSKKLGKPLEEKSIQYAIQAENQRDRCSMTAASCIFYLVKAAAVHDPKVIKLATPSRKRSRSP
jgi:Leucine Rich repeat